MDDTNVNEAEEFAREISKELANIITDKIINSEYNILKPSDLESEIFNYFKERNENRGRG